MSTENTLTVEMLKQAVPRTLKSSVTQELVDRVNGAQNDIQLQESYRENILGYISIMQTGKFKLEDYINAVKYVSYKLLGSTNEDAYMKTFPDRWQKLKDNGVKDTSPYSSAYHKNKLVNEIMAQTLVPNYIINAPYYQQAINVQVELMNDTNQSGKVRTDAANSLLTHLKAPEAAKVELDININKGSIIEDYEQVMSQMVAKQKELILAGADVKEIANASIKPKAENKSAIIDAEIEETE